MAANARSAESHVRDAACVSAAVLLVLLLLKVLERSSSERKPGVTLAHLLMERTQQYLQLSAQDEDRQMSAEHAWLATAYLDAARQVLGDHSIEQSTGVDAHRLYLSVDQQRQLATQALLHACPRLRAPHGGEKIPTTTQHAAVVTPMRQRL